VLFCDENMLRPLALSSAATNTVINNLSYDDNSGSSNYDKYSKNRLPYSSKIYIVIVFVALLFFGMVVRNNIMFNANVPDVHMNTSMSIAQTNLNSQPASDRSSASAAFSTVVNRAIQHKQHCSSIGLSTAEDKDYSELRLNNHTAHLKQWGILDAVRSYEAVDQKHTKKNNYPYQCQLPPENECQETHFTVIFMAYNPERLQKMMTQIKKMLSESDFSKMVAEVVIVWNGARDIDETDLGRKLVELGQTLPLRISYPLKAGFPNDLMNRYHPRLQVKTKAIMYYDDDGPFYSYKAVLGGFELWKRNANAQIGAMARKLDLGPRQTDESNAVLNRPGDRFFVSQCPADELHYNYNSFANFDARMVLPSGSFLHSNYLCFLWHPIFEEIRTYVKQHPVNPDDGTVSMVVSQLAGRAPKVYSRRINEQQQQLLAGKRQRRRLMDGINWDTSGAHDKKMNWGRLRSDVANSLTRYFGSVNSGSLGWCYGTQYHITKKKQDLCDPEMAKVGMLPWLKADHTARDTCP